VLRGCDRRNQDEIVFTDTFAQKGKYIVCTDPLDGSSKLTIMFRSALFFNLQTNNSTRRNVRNEDFLQEGSRQVAAGYIIYGSSTMLVYTTGNGVNGFTLDPSIGEFCLSHPEIKTPEDGRIYSVNEVIMFIFLPE